ncbi:MAG: shikimate kinase [Actinomycetota bacterium]|nr:shikimate kinase [Actinomycetota bacterium]
MSGPRAVLVGPPGAGKSTVGRLLAERMGTGFRDTDEDVEQSMGAPIADIFIDHGEARFRELETAAVRRALAEHTGVLALGGGAVLDAGVRALLVGHQVVWLQVGVADAARRVGMARDRPVLTLNPRKQLHQLLDARAPLYAEVARFRVDTDGREPGEVVAEVLAGLEDA